MTAQTPQGLAADEDHVLNHLASVFFGAKDAVSRKQLQHILLYTDGWMLVRGTKVNLRSKHIGAGIYHLWFEEAP